MSFARAPNFYIAIRILLSGPTPLCSPVSLSKTVNYQMSFSLSSLISCWSVSRILFLTQISALKLVQSGLSPWGFGDTAALLASVAPAPLSSVQPVLVPTPAEPLLRGGWHVLTSPNVCQFFIYEGHNRVKLKISEEGRCTGRLLGQQTFTEAAGAETTPGSGAEPGLKRAAGDAAGPSWFPRGTSCSLATHCSACDSLCESGWRRLRKKGEKRELTIRWAEPHVTQASSPARASQVRLLPPARTSGHLLNQTQPPSASTSPSECSRPFYDQK